MKEAEVLEETQDDAVIIERVAALDVGKAEVVCCVRIPSLGGGGRRAQEVRTWTTMTRSLAAMGDWLHGLGVTRVVMEATSDYWKPPFYLLEAAGFEVWLVNARDVKHLPGRPKTDPPRIFRTVPNSLSRRRCSGLGTRCGLLVGSGTRVPSGDV